MSWSRRVDAATSRRTLARAHSFVDSFVCVSRVGCVLLLIVEMMLASESDFRNRTWSSSSWFWLVIVVAVAWLSS